MNPFCPNLSNPQINSEFNELIDAFVDMFEGDRNQAEKMAYYLWNKNEGYSVDRAPNGEPSKLFQSHLEALNGDRGEAIRQTAKSLIQGKSHDNITVETEPTRPQEIVEEPESAYEDPIDELSVYQDADEYVVTKLADYMSNHPNMSDADINIKRREFINEYVQKKQRQIMNDTALKIADAFGLKQQKDGTWTIEGKKDHLTELRLEFVKSLGGDTEALIEWNSNSVSAHHLIRIGVDKGDPTTFNHEMAHYYIRTFWKSKLIQAALKMVSKPGMTDAEREEALVEKMVDISVENVYGTVFDNDNFFHTFWNKFANMLYNIFNIKTNTVRKQLMQNVTKAFMLNEQLSAIEDERVLFDMAEQTMYSKATAKFRSRKQKKEAEPTYRRTFERQDEQITESIIKHTEAKDKAYHRRGGINETQIIKLQDAVYSVRRSAKRIKDAIAAHRVDEAFHEKAELILNYMDRAVEEVADAVNAFNSAVSNNYREFVYMRYPNGTIVYTPQGNHREKITFTHLVNIKSDILSFHENLIGSIGKMLNDVAATKGFSSDDIDRIRDKYNTLKLSEQISRFRSTFDNALDKACIRDIIDYIDKNVPLEDDMKQRLKINMLKWLKDQNDFGDVSIYEQWVGLGSHSKSPVIRMMQDIINDLLYERDVPVEERGKHINNLLLKARKATTPGVIGVSKYNIKIGKFNLPTPWNIQKLLMEKGRNGLPTGNFATEINKGQYDLDKEDFIAELLYGKDGEHGIEAKIKNFSVNGTKPYKDFELVLDKYNTPIFPEDDALNDIIKEYYTELEKWRCENEDRQFTEKYYLERVDMLSPMTLRELDHIQSRVSEIYTACTVNGVVRTDLLTGMQRSDLLALRQQRTELYSFYNPDGTMKAQDSREFKIAQELAYWSMHIRDKVKYKIDYDKYNQALSLARDKAQFEKDNTSLVINPKVWEYYNRVVNSANSRYDQTDPDVIQLNKLIYMRNKLLNTVKSGEQGFYDMNQIFDSSTGNLKKRDFWVSLHSLETSIYNLSKHLQNKYPSPNKQANKNGFKKVFFNIGTPVDPNGFWFGNTVPRWINRVKAGVKRNTPSDVNLLYVGNTANPLSIFSMLVPNFTIEKYVDGSGNIVEKRVQQNENGEKYDIYIKAPNSNFSVIDKDASDGEYVNKSFDNSDGKTYRPKKSKYENKDFAKITGNPALKELYDELIKTMKESWELIPFLGDYDYRLPQMRGRTGQILGRRSNVFKSIGYQFASWWEINETDEWFNNDYQTRPDGSRMDFIPIRFIKRLDRPEYINSDVAGSVIQFFNMAKNYEVKSKVVPQFEAYLYELSKNKADDHKSWSDVSQEGILQHMIDVQMYGREQEVTVDSKKKDRHGSKRIARWMKRVKQSRGWAQSSLLAFNFASAIVSALDPMMSLTLDMLTGKYTNYKDFFYAVGVLVTDMPRAFASLGSVNTYSKANAAMQFFQLSKNNSATFRDLDRSQVMRFLSDGLPMKIFTVGDYTINCITMISTMNNYKLYEYKDSTEQNPHMKFLKKDEFIQEAIADGRTEDEAYAMYNGFFSRATLWDAFEVRGGRFVVKDKYKDIVDDQVLKNVRKQAQSRSAIYNGVVPDNERTKLQTNVWTAFITMLRNFLIMGINERFKSQRDFQVANFDQYGALGLKIEDDELLASTAEEIAKTKKEQSHLKGGWNFSTRTIEDGVFTGFGDVIRSMYGRTKYALGYYARSQQENYEAKQNIRQLSDFDKYAAKKVTLEIMSIALLYILSLFANQAADDDKNNYWKQLYALIQTRLPAERLTFYSPTLVSDLITSPTSAVSAFRRFLLIMNLVSDLVGMSDYSITDDVQQGTYGGQKRWFKDMCGILSGYGAHNLFTNTNAKSLREKNKFYKKLLPIDLHNLDALLEMFGIDIMSDRSSGRKSNKFGSFSNSFGGGFKNSF